MEPIQSASFLSIKRKTNVLFVFVCQRQVGDSIDSWQRFLQLHSLVVAWVDEKKNFLAEPLHLTSLVQARQKSQDYNVR